MRKCYFRLDILFPKKDSCYWPAPEKEHWVKLGLLVSPKPDLGRVTLSRPQKAEEKRNILEVYENTSSAAAPVSDLYDPALDLLMEIREAKGEAF